MHRHTSHRDSIDQAFDQLVADAVDTHARKQALFQARIASFTSWNINEASDALTFAGEAQQPLTVRITPVATYLVAKKEWAWAWANDGFTAPSRSKAARIKNLSDKTGYKIFQVPFFNANAQDIDELCALALSELHGSAIFKIKDQEPWCFYVVE